MAPKQAQQEINLKVCRVPAGEIWHSIVAVICIANLWPFTIQTYCSFLYNHPSSKNTNKSPH